MAGPHIHSATERHRSLDDLTGVPVTAGWPLVANGVGGLIFQDPASGSTGDGMVPYYIAAGDIFTVPLYKQALFAEAIEADGALVVNGLLMGVD